MGPLWRGLCRPASCVLCRRGGRCAPEGRIRGPSRTLGAVADRSLPHRRILLPCQLRRLCRGLGRMLGRHRRKERCGAGQSFDDKPRRRTRTSRSRGPNSRALSGIFASGSTPLGRDRCARRRAGRFARRGACSTASGAGGRSSSAGPATAGRRTAPGRAARAPGARGGARHGDATGARRGAARRAGTASGATGSARRTLRARRPRERLSKFRPSTSPRRPKTPVPKKPLRTTLPSRRGPL